MQVHIRQGNSCPLSLQVQARDLPALVRACRRHLTREEQRWHFHHLQDAVALLYLAGGCVHLYLYHSMELTTRGNLQLRFSIADGTQVQGGSSQGAKIRHLLYVLQG